jgi:hypothetical protein
VKDIAAAVLSLCSRGGAQYSGIEVLTDCDYAAFNTPIPQNGEHISLYVKALQLKLDRKSFRYIFPVRVRV